MRFVSNYVPSLLRVTNVWLAENIRRVGGHADISPQDSTASERTGKVSGRCWRGYQSIWVVTMLHSMHCRRSRHRGFWYTDRYLARRATKTKWKYSVGLPIREKALLGWRVLADYIGQYPVPTRKCNLWCRRRSFMLLDGIIHFPLLGCKLTPIDRHLGSFRFILNSSRLPMLFANTIQFLLSIGSSKFNVCKIYTFVEDLWFSQLASMESVTVFAQASHSRQHRESAILAMI